MTEGNAHEAGPGEDLGAVRRAWAARVEACVARMAERVPRSPFVVHPADARVDEVAVIDWGGFPLRVAACLTRADALALLDWEGTSGWEGRRRVQEEYVEWHVRRDDDGVVRRVVLTTELGDWWRVLAAYAPAEALRIAGELSGRPEVPSEALFGPLAPSAAGVTPEDREAAFVSTMLDSPAPYNTGERAVCCMVHPSNSLKAITALLFAAAFAFDDASGRCPPARAVIGSLADAAQDGRASDPLLVERLGRLAYEGRLIAFDEPVGVYIAGVEHTRLRCPGGEPVPAEWFRLRRDAGGDTSGDGAPRFQHLTVEVPTGEGLRVGDLVDAATELPITFGGQIADLVQLAMSLRVSAPRTVEVEMRRPEAPRPEAPAARGDATGCKTVRRSWAEFGEAAR